MLFDHPPNEQQVDQEGLCLSIRLHRHSLHTAVKKFQHFLKQQKFCPTNFQKICVKTKGIVVKAD